MTTEEKARAYDEALKVIKECNPDENGFITIYPQEIFSELAESEDERIRKALINGFKECLKSSQYSKNAQKYWHNIKIEDIFAWLEKQGEKPTDKVVEPKFHEGEWCIDNEDDTIFQIVKVLDKTYTCETNKGIAYTCTYYSLENDARLWTIQDAKDGDVLVASDNSLFIFEKVMDNGAYYHFSLCKNGSMEISDGNHAWETARACHPATKEQRDLLFQKMKEAGYEWDDEKKELKKIEHKDVKSADEKIRKILLESFEYQIKESYPDKEWICGVKLKEIVAWLEKQSEQKRLDYPYVTGWRENRPDNKPQIKHSVLMLTTHGVVEGEWLGEEWCQYRWSCKVKDTDVLYWLHLSDLESLEREGEQKHLEWSEEDEEYLAICKNALHQYQTVNQWDEVTVIKWLEEKLKQREQKQKWSEEDEMYLRLAIGSVYSTKNIVNGKDDVVEWLKSLKKD